MEMKPFWRRGAAALIAVLLFSTGAAAAQDRLSASELTAIPFPEQSWAWNEDENGNKRKAIDTAAAVANRSCGKTEFHAFRTSDPDAVRTGTTAAFEEAGWKIEDFSEGGENQVILRAAKDGNEVVMTWFPIDSGTAFFLCESFPLGAAPEQDAAPAAQAPAMDDESLDLSQAPWMFAAVFGAIGALILGQGIRSRRKAAASMAWPEANGTVLRSEVVHEVSTDAEGDTTEEWKPVVRYRYQVGGVHYESERLRFGSTGQGSAEQAQKALQPYPAGVSVTVRYNPAKPSEATLETVRPGLGSAIFVGGLFLFFAALAAATGLGG